MRLLELTETARADGNVAIHGYSYIRPLPFSSLDEEAEVQTDSLKSYSLAFILDAPVIVGVIGALTARLPAKGEAAAEDGYRYACAAAIQNMLLASHSLGLGSLWFTLFDESRMKRFLNIGADKRLVALVCLGYPKGSPTTSERIPARSKTRYLEP